MTVSASTQIPKTSDPSIFQRQCKVLFEHVLNDPNVKEYGSSGDAQGGIDLLGRRRSIALDHWVGIQCKLTIKATELKKGLIRKEAEKALSFDPTLKEFILVTTADDSGKMDAEGAAVTNEQAKLGRDFTVQVWGWQTLQTYIMDSERAIRAFWPDAFPHLDGIQKGQDRIFEELENNSVQQTEILSIVRTFAARENPNIASAAIPDGPNLGTFIDKQIDQFRALLLDGKPRTALGLLEGLWSNLPESGETRLRFRIKTNIAACKLRLNASEEAGKLYVDAYDYAPDEPKAAPLKILGLVLIGSPRDAIEFGMQFVGAHSDEGMLASYLLIAKSQLAGDDTDPFGFIDSRVEDSALLIGAKVDYLRAHPSHGPWQELAQRGAEKYPDDENLRRCAAEATIDQATRQYLDRGRAPLPPEDLENINKAADVLKQTIDRLLASEIDLRSYGVATACNLAIAYRVLGERDKARTIIDTCLARLPTDTELLEQRMLVALETGDSVVAQETAAFLPPSRDITFARLQIHANADNWPAVELLANETDTSTLADDDAAFFTSVVLLAKIKLAKVDAKSAIVDLLQTYPEQPIVPIVLYSAAVDLGDPVFATFLYNTAVELRSGINSASRSMLARIAENEQDPTTIVNLLDGYVDLTSNSSELRLLARGFVNSSVTQRSLNFVNGLSLALATQPFFARVIASIYFNAGDLIKAEEFFLSAVAVAKFDVAAHLGLIDTWLRLGKSGLVAGHLDKVDRGRLEGDPVHKMRFAQLLLLFGRTEAGLALGYETALANRDDLKAVQLYIGLVFDPSKARIRETGPVVQIDDWIRLEQAGGARLELVIEAGPDRPAINHFGPDSHFASIVLNKMVDEEVINTPALGTPQIWKIVEHKHKYLALLNEIVTTLPARFPDATGFYQFEIKDNDLTPVLEQVKSHSDFDAEILQLYEKDHYPLAFASALIGKGSVEFAGMLASRGIVRTCSGTESERLSAIAEIRKARAHGIVLDAFTAWVAHSLDIVPLLKAMFRRVALPQSAIDELSIWRGRFEHNRSEPLLTIGYKDGQLFKEEVSAEVMNSTFEIIGTGIAALREQIEILPAAAPRPQTEIETMLGEITKRRFLDPLYIGVSENLLLISDDMNFRNLGKQLFDLSGAWLQPVLSVALSSRAIDMKTYANAIVGLCARRHDYISLNAGTLLAIAEDDASEDLARLQIAAQSVCTDNSDVASNMKVCEEFLLGVWGSSLVELRQKKAAGIVLERLIPMMARGSTPQEYILQLLDGSKRLSPRLWRYLIDWTRGHFLFS